MSSSLTISPADQADFSRLPDKARQEVLRWLGYMDELASAGHGSKGRLVNRIASGEGLTPGAVHARQARFEAAGWRGLCNRTRYKSSCALPGTFLEWWRGHVDMHQRRKTTVRQAFRALILRLEAWERDAGVPDSQYSLPGYAAPPRRLRATRLPAGWSYNTLARYAPDKAERALRSMGRKAYSCYMPNVSATREGLHPGQIIFFDDEQPDVYVNFTGVNQKAQRPLGFHALDYVSGCNVCRGWKPQTETPDGGRTGLTEEDFYWFVLGFLTNHGWRADTGTVLVVEMGTAKISDAFAERLALATGGKVTRDHSGRFGDPAFRGMLYEGQSSGNFRYKAPIESWFNLERNYMAALPGATGRNRDEKPEETYGLLRADKAWLKLLESLPLERRLLMRSPVMEWSGFTRHADFLAERINSRTEHDLTDYEKLGYTVPVLSLPGQPEITLTQDNLALMSPGQRAVIDALTAQGAVRLRRLSPAEVWQHGSRGLTKLKGWQVPALMRPEDGRELTVSQQFELEHFDRQIDPEPLCYIARVRNEHGHTVNLTRGETYLCFLNPYAPDALQVCAPDGRWIGEAHRKPRVSRADTSGLHRLYHEVQDATAPERADIERRAAAEIHRRVADKKWNERVADVTKPLTPREHAAAAARADVRAALTHFAGADNAAGTPDPDADGGSWEAPAVPWSGDTYHNDDDPAAEVAAALRSLPVPD